MGTPARDAGDRVVGVDHLRAIAAIWVALSHVPPPTGAQQITPDTPWGLLARGVLNNAFNGQAAVFVFFVISGFCIHLRQADGAALPVRSFFAQRLIRLLLPLLIVVPPAIYFRSTALMLLPDSFAWSHETVARAILTPNSILWSLVCEAVYYVLYPALLKMARVRGWGTVATAAAIPAAGIVFAFPEAKDVPNYGHFMTWVVGLPAWIAGCVLAQDLWRTRPVSSREIWSWRGTIWAASMLASVMRFHAPFGLPWNGLGVSLNLFAWLCIPWLRAELNHARQGGRIPALERIGAMTYSMYLTHIPVQHHLRETAWRLAPALAAQPWILWLLQWIAIGLAAWLFHLCVERPSHRLARQAGRSLR